MSIRAYNELYLDDAMSALGIMIDYAVNYCGWEINNFLHEFVQSDVAGRFERGDPATASGKSGVELYRCVTGDSAENIPEYVEFDRSPEYWVGWALAYCQWHMSRTFRALTNAVKPDEMLRWYGIYHEMDILHVVKEFDKRVKKSSCNLERLRRKVGLSQSQLAALSTVSLRSIQMYEQGNNDISKAQFNVLNALARVLNCSAYDLIVQ